MDFLLKSGTTPPYVAVMKPVDFTRNVVERLIVEGHPNGRINGIVLLGDDDSVKTADHFSPEAACPNREFSLYNDDEDHCHQWNQPGSGLLLEAFPFPVFFVA